MCNLTIIAAIGKNNELGKNNDLIWHFKEDLMFFKENTVGKTIVMGFNTYKSLPKKLERRKYIVLTKRKVQLGNDVLIFNNIKDLLEYTKKYKDEIMVIGGASIYKQLLDYCHKMLLTEIDAECCDADAYFPKFNKDDWKVKTLSSHTSNNISYKHKLYIKKEKA